MESNCLSPHDTNNNYEAEDCGMNGETQSSSLELELEGSILPLTPQSCIIDSMIQDYRPVRSLSSNRPLPSLYPNPGKIPGSRKRRVNASNGPNSLLQETPEKHPPKLAQVTPFLERKADYERISPGATEFMKTSLTSPSSPDSDANPPFQNKTVDLMMTPPTLPKKTVAFGYGASPRTPEITTFMNLSIRSPILSHSPGSPFSQYPNKLGGMKSPLGKMSSPGFQSPLGKMSSPCFQSPLEKMGSPVFQSSPSPRQVPLKILSNIPPKTCSPPTITKRSPRMVKLSPRFSDKKLASRLSAKMGVAEDSLNSPHKLEPPILMFSSRVSPNDSYTIRKDDRETIDQRVRQPWPISDDSHFQHEAARPPLTPPLLPRRIPSNNHLKKSAISSLKAKSTIKQSSLKQFPSFSSQVIDTNEIDMGDEMNVLLNGFLSSQPKNPAKNVSEKSFGHVPRNINILQNFKTTNTMKRHDSMTFSDDDSNSGKSTNQDTESHEPPIKMLSLGQRIGKQKLNSKSRCNNQNESPQWSLLKPGLHISNEALHDMLQDASEIDCDDTVGSLSDDEEVNSFFLTSPKRCLNQPVLPEKGKESLSRNFPLHNTEATAERRIGNKQKKTRVTPDGENNWILNNKTESIHDPHVNQYENHYENENVASSCGYKSESCREPPKADKMRRHHHFSNMGVISENSVSNVSLIGMTYLTNDSTSVSRGIRSSSNGSKSSSDDGSNVDRSNNLRRNQSDQSLHSLGLCLEGTPLDSDTNLRDTMVTPPIIRNDSLTPPPIKKSRLGTAFL